VVAPVYSVFFTSIVPLPAIGNRFEQLNVPIIPFFCQEVHNTANAAASTKILLMRLTRVYLREEISGYWGDPPGLLGIRSKANPQMISDGGVETKQKSS
jgi:hypothetical protein